MGSTTLRADTVAEKITTEVNTMNPRQKYFSLLGITALLGGAFPAFAAPSAPSLGTASGFAVLSALTTSPGAVTCTTSTITGDVGTASTNPLSVTQTLCTITGTVFTPVSAGVLTDFNGAYNALAGQSCDQFLTGTLAGITL